MLERTDEADLPEEEIELVYEDYEPEDEAPAGNLTPDDQEGDCAGESEEVNDGT